MIAWQGWNWYQRKQTGEASVIYGALQQAVATKNTQQIKAASGELLEKFGGTSYAVLGALTSANAMIEAGDTQTAKVQLQWAAEHAKDELRDLAQLRGSAVLLDEKAYDQALGQLSGASSLAFEMRFQDMRGDIFVAQGKKTEAVSAYRAALAKLSELEKAGKSGGSGFESQGEANTVFRDLTNQKIEALGGDQ